MQKTFTGRALDLLFRTPKAHQPSSVVNMYRLGNCIRDSPTIEIFTAEQDKFTIVASQVSGRLLKKLERRFPEAVWERSGVLTEAAVNFSGDIFFAVKSTALTAAHVILREDPYKAHSLSGFTYSITDFDNPNCHAVFWLKLPSGGDGVLDAAFKVTKLLPYQRWTLVSANRFETWLVSVLDRHVLNEAIEICARTGAAPTDPDPQAFYSPVFLIFSRLSGPGSMLFDFRCPQHWLLFFLSDSFDSLKIEARRLCLHLNEHDKSRLLALAALIGLEVVIKDDLGFFDGALWGRP